MNKTAVRGIGFAGALGATVALIGAAASTTGAYFTDSKDGSINAGTGHVKVDTSDRTLNFADLLPGEYKTQNIDYAAHGTGAEDIWLVLPTDGSAEALLGRGSDGLGRYGHFKVTSTNGASFVSNNLRTAPAGTSADQICTVNEFGSGGSTKEVTSTNPADDGYYVPYCAPQTAILLANNLQNNEGGTATVEFGFTRLLKNGQDAPLKQLAAYKIVATQHGIRPDNPFN